MQHVNGNHGFALAWCGCSRRRVLSVVRKDSTPGAVRLRFERDSPAAPGRLGRRPRPLRSRARSNGYWTLSKKRSEKPTMLSTGR